MKVVLTGGHGFLGWHTRARLQARGDAATLIAMGSNFDLDEATAAVENADRVVHLAGVNRGTDVEIESGNLLFARQLACALSAARTPPLTVVYANSIQAGNQTKYGDSKSKAGETLEVACDRAGIDFANVRLPNIFGEHGKPFYNSVVATFCHLLSKGEVPQVQEDRELALLHVQHAASWILGETNYPEHSPSQLKLPVSSLLDVLTCMASTYARGEIPDLASAGGRDLFNTYRSFLVGNSMSISADRRQDSRGSFFEVVRTNGGAGQTSFSTTHPGVTRGEHYHLNKVERFTVLSGEAIISMRGLFHKEVLTFRVNGNEPVSLDMPTLWTHKIENVGTSSLYTMFWTNDIFDPHAPDTFSEKV